MVSRSIPLCRMASAKASPSSMFRSHISSSVVCDPGRQSDRIRAWSLGLTACSRYESREMEISEDEEDEIWSSATSMPEGIQLVSNLDRYIRTSSPSTLVPQFMPMTLRDPIFPKHQHCRSHRAPHAHRASHLIYLSRPMHAECNRTPLGVMTDEEHCQTGPKSEADSELLEYRKPGKVVTLADQEKSSPLRPRRILVRLRVAVTKSWTFQCQADQVRDA